MNTTLSVDADCPPNLHEVLARSGFLESDFERNPRLIEGCFLPSVTIDHIFEIIPEADKDRQVRYLDQSTGDTGYGRDWVDAEMSRRSGSVSQRARSMFDEGLCSFAVQDCERYVPAVQEAVDRLHALTGHSISVTAFLTPPQRSATKAHYDCSDVLALQVAGRKTWKVGPPIDVLPNNRTPILPIDHRDPARETDFDLSVGRMLYLPRGWIHAVENTSSEPSLHLSFVIFAETWLGVFSNLMNAAHADLRSRPAWRQSVRPTELRADEAAQRIKDMCGELASSMMDLLGLGVDQFRDHCCKNQPHRTALEFARRALAEDGESGEGRYMLVASGAHVLRRHPADPSLVLLSTDGEQYVPINRALYDHLCASTEVDMQELEALNLCQPDQLVDELARLTSSLGAYAVCRRG